MTQANESLGPSALKHMSQTFKVIQEEYPNLIKGIREGNKNHFQGSIRRISRALTYSDLFDESFEVPAEYKNDIAFREVKKIYEEQDDIIGTLNSYIDCDKYITTYSKFVNEKIIEAAQNPDEKVLTLNEAKKLQKNLQTLETFHSKYDDLVYLEDEKRQKVNQIFEIVSKLLDNIDTIMEMSK